MDVKREVNFPHSLPNGGARGLALASLLLGGSRLWPGVYLGALAANALTGNLPAWAPFLIAAGNTLEAVAGAHLIRRFSAGSRPLETGASAVVFVLGALIAPVVSAAVGTLTLQLAGQLPPGSADYLWFTWWAGDAGGGLVVAPLLLAWARREDRWARADRARFVLLLGALALWTHFVFDGFGPGVGRYSVEYLIFPLVFWAALGFGLRGVTSALGVVSFLAIVNTLGGRGPFVTPQPNESLLLLALFLGTVAITGLIVAGLVTDRRRQREATHRVTAKLVTLFSASPDLYFWLAPDGTIADYRAGDLSSLYLSPENFLGKRMQDLLPAEAGSAFATAIRKAEEGGQSIEYPLTVGEERRHFEARLFPVRAEKQILVVVRDITARKAQEEALLRSNAELERFAYVASHDMQEPMRTIITHLQLIEMKRAGFLDGEARVYFDYVVGAARRLKALVQGILDYSRLGSDRPMETVDPNGTFRQVREALAVPIETTGAVLTVDPLPPVRGNPSQIFQLFLNLVGNALKFRGDKVPRIHVGVEERDGEAVFFVRDEGIGIDPRYHDRVFGLFHRLHPQSRYPGAGIGLATRKRIVDRHRGSIWVESEPDAGATFFFKLQGDSPRTSGIR